MNDFNEIKEQWRERKLPVFTEKGQKEIVKKGKSIQRKQTITQIILSLTVVILIWFFIYIAAYKNSEVTRGLLLMIGSLVLRIIIEFIFKLKAKNFKLTQNSNDFNNNLIKYYKSRLYINYILIPILFISYIVGFVMLLPAFKENLSFGFYKYITYSSYIIFALLAFFIAVQVKKELETLRNLSDYH